MEGKEAFEVGAKIFAAIAVGAAVFFGIDRGNVFKKQQPQQQPQQETQNQFVQEPNVEQQTQQQINQNQPQPQKEDGLGKTLNGLKGLYNMFGKLGLIVTSVAGLISSFGLLFKTDSGPVQGFNNPQQYGCSSSGLQVSRINPCIIHVGPANTNPFENNNNNCSQGFNNGFNFGGQF